MSALPPKADVRTALNSLSLLTAEADKQLFEAALTAAARSVALPRLLSAVRTSAFGVKRTWRIALQMSAFDPKRTSLRGVAALFREIAARKPPPSVK